jgi:hypothetical protein
MTRSLSCRPELIGGCLLLCVSSIASGHTLPISYLTVVPDEDYVHVELVLNPYELNFFAELDANHNRLLDREEMARFREVGTELLLAAIEIRVVDRPVRAEAAGADLALGSHHLVLRAHYRIDARRLPLKVVCTLTKITSGGHVTVVNYVNMGRKQTVLLDRTGAEASFAPATPREGAAHTKGGK